MSQFAEMKSGAEMRDHIIGKATDDAVFRTRLVADPKGVLNDEFGVSLPDSFAISVHEDSSTHVHLVLPTNSELDANELKAITAAHNGVSGVCSNCSAPGSPALDRCW